MISSCSNAYIYIYSIDIIDNVINVQHHIVMDAKITIPVYILATVSGPGTVAVAVAVFDCAPHAAYFNGENLRSR